MYAIYNYKVINCFIERKYTVFLIVFLFVQFLYSKKRLQHPCTGNAPSSLWAKNPALEDRPRPVLQEKAPCVILPFPMRPSGERTNEKGNPQQAKPEPQHPADVKSCSKKRLKCEQYPLNFLINHVNSHFMRMVPDAPEVLVRPAWSKGEMPD